MSCSAVSWSDATSEPPKVVRTPSGLYILTPQRRALFRHLNFQKWSDAGVFCPFWLRNVLRATTACTFSTSEPPKVARTCDALYILTSKCASRHNGVHFFNIRTSKSGANMWCFVHFDLEMCFAPQRRALFRHLNCQKWSGPGVFCTFWLGNVLRATTACTFSTSESPKVVRTWCALYILTWKCALRHNGVHFFISHLASWLRTRRFSEPTFRPSRTPNHWKNTVFRDFPTLSRICIFFLLLFFLLIFLFSLPLPYSAFHLSILSEVWLQNFLRILIIVPKFQSYIWQPTGIFSVQNKGFSDQGYEPKQSSLCFYPMENMRARSLPPGNDGLVNPFHSEKVQTEYLLHAARPSNLPDVSGMEMEQPVQDASRLAPPRSLMTDAPTGKGRGCQTAGAMPTAMEPTVAGSGNMQTEGRLPGVEKLGSPEVSLQGDDLQRSGHWRLRCWITYGEKTRSLPMR